jgi:hypothetical protein
MLTQSFASPVAIRVWVEVVQDDPAPIAVQPDSKPRPQPVYWNALAGTYQSDEQLWSWSGPWDL